MHHLPHISHHLRPGGRGRMISSNMNPDDVYLSYHDICLWKEDVDCLKNDWLTDNNIAFWEEYLEHEKLYKLKEPRPNVCLLRPSMVYLIQQTPDAKSLESALPPFKSAQYTHIFLPINNNTDPSVAEGGSHWSLMVISVVDGIAFHYDSLHETNHEEARVVCQKMSNILEIALLFQEVKHTPQQRNSSDCGVHVCVTLQYLLMDRLLETDAGKKVDMGLKGVKFDCSSVRMEMLATIRSFRKQASRSRSPALNGSGGHAPRIE